MSRSKLTVKFLGEILQDVRSVTERPLDVDPVMEHYIKFTRGLDDLMLPYKELHRNLRQSARQLSITELFHPYPSTSGAPVPSPASPAYPASHSVSDSSGSSLLVFFLLLWHVWLITLDKLLIAFFQ